MNTLSRYLCLLPVFLLCTINVPAWGMATADSFASGTISIVDIQDGGGSSIPVPTGFQINPFTSGGTSPDTESGNYTLTLNGSDNITGSGVTTSVSVVADVTATASPAGEAEGIETYVGDIQFINGSGISVTVIAEFSYDLDTSVAVTLPGQETADSFADVEFSLNSGGGSSPCNSPLLVDLQQLISAPPDEDPAAANGSRQDTFTLAPGQTCSLNALVQGQSGAEAQAMPGPDPSSGEPVPALGIWQLLVLVALLGWAARRRV